MQGIMVGSYKTLRQLKYIFTPKKEYKSSSLDSEIIRDYNRQRIYGPRTKLCYAPFTSMFFSREGKMSPCYATYNHKSDCWPQQSIYQAWFNGEFEHIRANISNGNLDYACGFCKPIFISKSFGSLLPNKYEPYGIGKTQYPKIMEFELSNRCNLECIMCDGNLSSAIRNNRDCLPAHPEHYTKDFVEQLEEFIPHLQMAEFTGGDPFLISIYYDIWEKIQQLNPSCQILITTNANTMSTRIEDMLIKHQNLHFNISLDSLNKSHYEQIRKNAVYENVIKHSIQFINYCKQHNTSCNLLVCPMTINCKDFKEIIEFANTHDICVYFHTVVKPKNLSLKYQSATYLTELINYLNTYSPPTASKNQKINASNYHNLIELLQSWAKEKHTSTNHELFINETHLFVQLKKQLDSNLFNRLQTFLKEYQSHILYNQLLQKLQQIKPEELELILQNLTDNEIHQHIEKLIRTLSNNHDE
jgi:molybdenum cofactor biosynthesis enzyme MoaA